LKLYFGGVSSVWLGWQGCNRSVGLGCTLVIRLAVMATFADTCCETNFTSCAHVFSLILIDPLNLDLPTRLESKHTDFTGPRPHLVPVLRHAELHLRNKGTHFRVPTYSRVRLCYSRVTRGCSTPFNKTIYPVRQSTSQRRRRYNHWSPCKWLP
jgi:hypothetical protein